MKILIIGARGMLGRDLQPILSPRHEVIGTDLDELDITRPGKLREALDSLRPDVVINLAAVTDVDGCESQRERAFLVNAHGALEVARGCAATGARLIHLSTDYVFDGTSPVPYTEEILPRPLNVYGESKLLGERGVQETGGNYLILRTAWLYGQHGKNFVDTILRLSSQQEEIRVVNDQRGSPTYTRDLSRAIELLLKREERGVLHVTNSGSCTWFEFAGKILALKNPRDPRVRLLPISSAELGRPAKRPANSVLDCSKFEIIAGWKMRRWEECLKEYIS
ncbi:MAG TPA: dTDP-4-dehydrorhamnose reductase [Thermodesulfobacteriota bacterium]|nr:dTDP-4-dehydrorhamnose reductase [Thermodesulfobacteriota bacterium]